MEWETVSIFTIVIFSVVHYVQVTKYRVACIIMMGKGKDSLLYYRARKSKQAEGQDG